MTENQIRLTSTGACLSQVSVITGPKNCFMLAVFISMIRNCNGFKDNEVPTKVTNWSGFEQEPSIQYFNI